MLHNRTYTLCGTDSDNPWSDEVHSRLVHDLPTGRSFDAARTSAQGLILVLGGSGRLAVDGVEHRLGPGAGLRYVPGLRLSWRSPGARLVRATIKGPRAAAALDAAGIAPARSLALRPAARSALASALRELRTGSPGYAFPVRLAWILIGALAPASPNVEPAVEESCRELIEEGFDQGLQVTGLARRLAVDRSTLYRRFRARYGCSPKAHLDELRLRRAEELLRTTALGVAEIAAACGFDRPDQLARRYRARYGLSPRERRESL